MAFPTSPLVLVCGRPGDPWLSPRPGSVAGRCGDCGHEVVVSPAFALQHMIEGRPIVCIECFARHRDEGHPVDLRWPSP